MRIKFLGTSYGAPNPGRHCQSILLETDCGNAYLVDVGAPVLNILANECFDFKKIKAIFITHLHGDHMNGLLDVMNLTDYLEMRYQAYLPERRGIDAFELFASMQSFGSKSDRCTMHLFKSGVFYDDGNMKVTAYLTAHMEHTSNKAYGFLLEADGRKIYITGDLHPSLKDFPALLFEEQVDLIVTECAHFSAQNLLEKLEKCKTKKAAVIHVHPLDQYEYFRQNAMQMPFELLLPNDGDIY